MDTINKELEIKKCVLKSLEIFHSKVLMETKQFKFDLAKAFKSTSDPSAVLNNDSFKKTLGERVEVVCNDIAQEVKSVAEEYNMVSVGSYLIGDTDSQDMSDDYSDMIECVVMKEDEAGDLHEVTSQCSEDDYPMIKAEVIVDMEKSGNPRSSPRCVGDLSLNSVNDVTKRLFNKRNVNSKKPLLSTSNSVLCETSNSIHDANNTPLSESLVDNNPVLTVTIQRPVKRGKYKKKIPSTDNCFECFICHKKCSRRTTLNCHIRTHTGEKPFQCDICGKAFAHQTAISRHRKTHGNRTPFTCPFCGKSFINKDHFRAHKKTHTEDTEGDFQCDECGKYFTTKFGLDVHLRIHSSERPYTCDVCGKSFRMSNALKVHKRIHTGEKPYQCTICSKDFGQQSALKMHILQHTGEKPYKCAHCEKCFRLASALKTHTRKHTGERPYQCDFCSKSFTAQQLLVNHIRVHTGEQPYECKTCGKRFSQRCNLIQHERIHTGEKPCVCAVCGKAFSSVSTLSKHRKIHNKSKEQQLL